MKRRKNDSPLISIVILNYNGLKYLTKTIPPILELEYPNYEIVVVDNDSNDNSVNYLDKIQKKTKLKFRIIKNQKNYGYSIGKNIGVRKSKGKYILMLDCDILVLDKEILNKLLRNYLSLTRCAILGICILDRDEITTKNYGRYYDFAGSKEIIDKININKIIRIKRPFRVGFASGGAIFLNKDIWFELGEYDESQPFYIDDHDIGARAYNFGYNNYLVNNLYVIHLEENRQKLDIWLWKYRYYFSGKCRGILKNYILRNLLIYLPSFILVSILKSAKQSVKKGPLVWKYYFYSVGLFLKKLPETLKKRKEIQAKRKVKMDLFLKINPPKFDD